MMGISYKKIPSMPPQSGFLTGDNIANTKYSTLCGYGDVSTRLGFMYHKWEVKDNN